MVATGHNRPYGLVEERQRWSYGLHWTALRALVLLPAFVLSGGIGWTQQAAPTLNGLNPALQAPTATAPATSDDANNETPRLPQGFGLNQRRVAPAQSQPSNEPTSTAVAPVPRQRPGAARNANVVADNRTPIRPVAVDQSTVAGVRPTQGPGRRTSDLTPFAPTGLRRGKFILRPSIESGVGFTTNSVDAPGGTASAVLSTEGSIVVDSDFSRHAVGVNITAGVDRFLSGPDALDFDVNANVTGRLDVNERTALSGRLGVSVAEDDVDGTTDNPLQKLLTAGIGVTRRVKQLELTNEFRVTRNINDSFVDSNGVLQSQDDQNSTVFGFNLRGTLNRQAAFRPFAELDISRERFDVRRDLLGNDRTATGLRGTVGLVIDRGEKLNGEFGVGYQQNLFSSAAIPDFGALVADFNINWSPRRLTTINLNGSTTLDSIAEVGTPGDITYDFNLALTQQLRENLTATVGGGLNFVVDALTRDTDTTVSANLGLAWSLNRVVSLTADYNFTREFTANGAGDFTTNTFTLGIRAER